MRLMEHIGNLPITDSGSFSCKDFIFSVGGILNNKEAPFVVRVTLPGKVGGQLIVKKMADLPICVKNPTCIVVKDTVYVLGGSVDGKPNHRVFSARVDKFGYIHKWYGGPSLPNPMLGTTFAHSRGNLIAVGGTSRNAFIGLSKEVYAIGIYSGGFGDNWKPVHKFHYAVHDALPLYGVRDHLHVVGGYTSKGPSNVCCESKYTVDGDIFKWECGAKVIEPIVGGYTFDYGNLNLIVTTLPNGSGILYAIPKQVNGTLGCCRIVCMLPETLTNGICCVVGDYLYATFTSGVITPIAGIYKFSLKDFLSDEISI